MSAPQQRSNFNLFTFHPSASPKRLNSLGDMCRVLEQSCPKDSGRDWEVTEWRVCHPPRPRPAQPLPGPFCVVSEPVTPAYMAASRPAEFLSAPAGSPIMDNGDQEMNDPDFSQYQNAPGDQVKPVCKTTARLKNGACKPPLRPGKPTYQQTILNYPVAHHYSEEGANSQQTSLSSDTAASEPMDVDSAKPEVPEFNAILEEVEAAAAANSPFTLKGFSLPRVLAQYRNESARDSKSTPKPQAKPRPPPKKPPQVQSSLLSTRSSPPVAKQARPAKSQESMDAISKLFAAEAAKTHPNVIDLDAVTPDPPAPPVNPPKIVQTNGHTAESKPIGQVIGFQCPVPGCLKKYRRRCRVIEHMKLRHNPEGVPRYQCSETSCQKSYSRLDALKLHQRSESHKGYAILFEPHDGPHPPDPIDPVKIAPIIETDADGSVRFKCKFGECEKTYSTRYRLNMHETACHGSSIEKPFSCTFQGCSKAYATKDSLTRHRRNYGHGTEQDGEKPKDGDKQDKPKEAEATVEFQDRVQELVELFDEI